MTARLLAGGLALLALAGCGGGGGEEAPAASALQAVSRPPSPREAAKLVSRSLWAVVPTAPKKKQDVRPELIRGSAVAVADDTLLASCGVLGKRKQVGLIRHNKYRLAQLAAADPRREVCVLRVPDGPLNVAAGYRDPADLRLGEPIYALVNRTAADVALAQGQVTELPVGPAAPRLRTSLVLPAGVQSGVLIDGYGNLVGVAGPQPGTAGGMMAAAVTGRLAPRLASFEAPTPTVPVPAPRVQPAAFPAPQPVLVMRLDDDEDTERQSVRAAAPAVAAAPAAEADSTTDSPERSSASGGSRNGGRGEAGRGGKGGQSGNGNSNGGRGGQGSGGGTAGGGTGGTGTGTGGADPGGTDPGGAGADGGVDDGGTAPDDGPTPGTGTGGTPGTGSTGGFDFGSAVDAVENAGLPSPQSEETAAGPAPTGPSDPGTGVDDGGNGSTGKGNGGKGGKSGSGGNGGKGGGNSGKGGGKGGGNGGGKGNGGGGGGKGGGEGG